MGTRQWTDKGDLQARVMRDILEERDYQDRKWGADRNHANADWLMILGTVGSRVFAIWHMDGIAFSNPV